MLLIPKYIIKELFEKYEGVIPDFNNLPEHIRIGIDIGFYKDKQGSVELYLLEAILFEYMCCLFNQTNKYFEKQKEKGSDKKTLKTYDALFGATITSTYNLLEAYLNGIAFDYYIIHEDIIDIKTKGILLDFDYERNKPKYLSLRDKVLQYLKIIKNTQHPPLQENNCPELKFVLEYKQIRDSIIHASLQYDIENYEPKKEQNILEFKYDELELIVDNMILLIEKIECEISGSTSRLWWLYKRDENGIFSDDVLK